MDDYVSVLTNLAASMVSVEKLVTGTAYLIGLAFAMKALHSLKVFGESRTMMSSSQSIKDPLIHLLVAGILIYFPTGFEMMMNTTFGYSTVIAYAPINSGNPILSALFGEDSAIGSSLALIIQVVGVVAFVRGWVLIARSASQGQPPGGTGRGLIHVFGGVLAMNIVGTLEVLTNTLYGVN